MHETLQVPVPNSELTKERTPTPDALRARAQGILRKVRPEDAPRHELTSIKPIELGGGAKLLLSEAWQDSENPDHHDKRIRLAVQYFKRDETGVLHEAKETLATFHDLQPVDADGETSGYKPVTPGKDISLEGVGAVLMILEQSKLFAATPRDVGGAVVRSAAQG